MDHDGIDPATHAPRTPIWLYGLRAVVLLVTLFVAIAALFNEILWPGWEPEPLGEWALKAAIVGVVITLWEWSARRGGRR